MKSDIIIIGSGLFGSATAKMFMEKGMSVLLIDSNDPMAASKCSFGVWRDGWVSSTLRPFVDDGMEFLEKMTGGVQKMLFEDLSAMKEIEMSRVDCSKILDLTPDIIGEVTEIKNNHVFIGEEQYTAKKAVIVCAGAKTYSLLGESGYITGKLDSYWGATFDLKRIKGDTSNKIATWAPYKQSVFMQKDSNTFVFGDGATVKNPKPNDPRVEKTSERIVTNMRSLLQCDLVDNITAINEGLRPYIAKGEQFIQKHDSMLYSATGGAKNSTILCGYIARELFFKVAVLK